MNEQALGEDLNRLLALESRGLLRFLDRATPYLTPETFKIWGDLQAMATATGDRSRRLTELLESLELPVRPASFDTVVANYHYTSLKTVLPLLADQTRSMIDVNQRAIKHSGHHPKARDELMSLLVESQDRLEKLQTHASHWHQFQ